MNFNRLVYLIILTALAGPAAASEPARVMAIGTFHFKDAGLDVAKVDDFNVMTADPQLYLEKLTDQMASFKPTAVLLEYNPENETETNERYAGYLAGTFELPTNEIYQLGFRIARAAFAPGAPITPPPGCADDPQRYSPFRGRPY